MISRSTIGIILLSMTLTVVRAQAPGRPVYVCMELVDDMTHVRDSLLKIEKALNRSGAFMTTQIASNENMDVMMRPGPNKIPREDRYQTSGFETYMRAATPPRAQVTRKRLRDEKYSSKDDSTGDLEQLFMKTLVYVCRSVFPQILTRDPLSTPFRHQNCSVLCVYGYPSVKIPDGGMCYQQSNYIGTPGHCRDGECVIPGRPFQFDYPVDEDPPQPAPTHSKPLQLAPTRSNSLQPAPSRSNSLQSAPSRSNSLQPAPTRSNSLQTAPTHFRGLHLHHASILMSSTSGPQRAYQAPPEGRHY